MTSQKQNGYIIRELCIKTMEISNEMLLFEYSEKFNKGVWPMKLLLHHHIAK